MELLDGFLYDLLDQHLQQHNSHYLLLLWIEVIIIYILIEHYTQVGVLILSRDEVQLEQDFMYDELFIQIEHNGLLHWHIDLFDNVLWKKEYGHNQKYKHSIIKLKRITEYHKKTPLWCLSYNQYFDLYLLK